MQRPKLLPPPRWGDHGAVNRHLTAGGTVEGIVRDNPYLPYIKQLMEKTTISKLTDAIIEAIGIDNARKVARLILLKKWLNATEQIDETQLSTEEERQFFKVMKRHISETMKEFNHDNPCGKPHNNGEDTCNECQVIKKGV